MEPPVQAARRYRGVTAAERSAATARTTAGRRARVVRHERLRQHVDRGAQPAASLNSRYFYESFTSREDLLYHVYLRIVTDLATKAGRRDR